MRVASLRPSRISLRSSGLRLLRTSAGELEMRQDRRGNRQQCRGYPDRPQEKDGNCALPAGAARNPEQCREAAEQANQSKPGTEPNASHAPAPTGKPWHDGKAEGQDNQELHQNVEHGSSPDGLLDTPTPHSCSCDGLVSSWSSPSRGGFRTRRKPGKPWRRAKQPTRNDTPCQAPPLKIFHFTEIRICRTSDTSWPVRRGGSRSSRTAGRGAVDATASGANGIAGRDTVSMAFARTTRR